MGVPAPTPACCGAPWLVAAYALTGSSVAVGDASKCHKNNSCSDCAVAVAGVEPIPGSSGDVPTGAPLPMRRWPGDIDIDIDIDIDMLPPTPLPLPLLLPLPLPLPLPNPRPDADPDADAEAAAEPGRDQERARAKGSTSEAGRSAAELALNPTPVPMSAPATPIPSRQPVAMMPCNDVAPSGSLVTKATVDGEPGW